MAEQPTQQSSGSSSSGGDTSWIDDIWGIVTDIFGAFSGDSDALAIARAQRQDKAMFDEQQQAYYRQQRRDNLFRQRGEKFAQDQFNFGKTQFGKEFNITKQQWLAQRKQIEIDNKRTGTDKLVGGMMNSQGMKQAGLDAILQRARS